MAEDFFLDDIANTTQEQPSVAVLPDGDFVAVWDQFNEDVGVAGSFDIESRVYDANGVALTPGYQADTGQQGDDQSGAQVAALSDGSWVVAWDSDGGDDIQTVYLQHFSLVNGVVTRLGQQVQISPTRTGSSGNPYYDQYLNSVVALPDGGYRIVYTGSDVSTDWTVYEQEFNAAGQNVGGETVINSDVNTGLAEAFSVETPGYQLMPLADGGFVAAYWEEAPTYPVGDQIWLQSYNAAAAAVGGPVLVTAPTDTNNNQFPSITALAGGDYAVTWTSTNTQNLQISDAEVRVYDASGNPVSDIERINTVTGEQDAAGQVVALSNGNFLATYVAFEYSESADDYYAAIGRVYSADGQPLSSDFTISSFDYIDMTNLQAKALSDGDVAVTWTGGEVAATNVYETILSSTDIPTLCFVQGTQIATPSGERAVESLAIGDTVLTLAGPARRIAWIGRGQVLAARGRRNAATPIIVRKGALADNVPNRDLRITKGHALYLDDVLIPVEFLVNHRSILWDDHAQEVSLYHVELDSHDVLLANGAPAESYRDDGNRWLFQNANTSWDQPAKPPYAPIVTGGPAVDAVWRRLLDRTGLRRSLPLTDDSDAHLLVDGKRCDPIERRHDTLLFRLAVRPYSVRIRSRTAAPQELGLARDPRSLGLALRSIVLARPTQQRTTKADAATLVDGYHAFEPDNGIRWTNGNAALPSELFAWIDGPFLLTLDLGGATKYLEEGPCERAA